MFMRLFYKTRIKHVCYLLAVHVLSDEHKFLHAVAIPVVPVALHSRVVGEESAQLVCRHCGIPLSGVAQRYLFSCLLKHIACVLLVIEIADALCADDGFWPFACHELVEFRDRERFACIVDECADAVFFSLAGLFIVVAVAACASFTVVMMVLMVVVMVVAFVLFIVVMVVMMLLIMI